MMPPAKSQPKAPADKASNSFEKANTHVQPIPIYNNEENHFGQFIQNALIVMPMIAMLQTMQRRMIPVAPFNSSRQIGV